MIDNNRRYDNNFLQEQLKHIDKDLKYYRMLDKLETDKWKLIKKEILLDYKIYNYSETENLYMYENREELNSIYKILNNSMNTLKDILPSLNLFFNNKVKYLLKNRIYIKQKIKILAANNI
jgi:hypothetical protein